MLRLKLDRSSRLSINLMSLFFIFISGEHLFHESQLLPNTFRRLMCDSLIIQAQSLLLPLSLEVNAFRVIRHI